jgi:hypothetical protein
MKPEISGADGCWSITWSYPDGREGIILQMGIRTWSEVEARIAAGPPDTSDWASIPIVPITIPSR